MKRFSGSQIVLLAVWIIVWPGRAGTQTADTLPSPLSLTDAVRIATERRSEIQAARAQARAGEARPSIASALEDPMVSPSLDHLPFNLRGADVSVTIEQRFPLSGVREHRRAAALADLQRLQADTSRITLDVGIQSANAFLMLLERRRAAALVSEQTAFARAMVTAADARYATGTAPQSDVLRAEVEVARLVALERTLASDVRGAEAMLNTNLGRDAELPVPSLVPVTFPQAIPAWSVIKTALTSRPELAAGQAQIARAGAEVEVMRDMSKPMVTLRTGPSYTMAEGRGWMGMVGFSLPIWRDKLRAGVAEAEAMRAMSEADLQAMIRMIEGDAGAAINQLQAARDRQAALSDEVLPRARLAVEPAVAGYAAGRLPLVSVIEAVQTLWSVQLNLIAADTELGLAWARLGRAMGTYEGIVP